MERDRASTAIPTRYLEVVCGACLSPERQGRIVEPIGAPDLRQARKRAPRVGGDFVPVIVSGGRDRLGGRCRKRVPDGPVGVQAPGLRFAKLHGGRAQILSIREGRRLRSWTGPKG